MANWPAPTHDTIKAKMARFRSPGYSHCGRCGMPWKYVEGHQTPYGGGFACFPLCTGCWTVLDQPDARSAYYDALLDEWSRSGHPVDPAVRQAIGRAVAGGL